MTDFLGLYNYWIVIFLMMTGFYIVIARENLIKTIIGLNIFQTSVFLLYITMGKVTGGTAPILKGSHSGESHGAESHGAESHGAEHGQELHAAAEGHLDSGVEAVTEIYSNPIPSVLMLTAIVVGIATTALALALVVRIREEYGTIEEDEILEMDRNS
ncbi:MAG: cation:proton antiporter subunit C [Mariniblastus sp.]|nr:cation:proton antiporter subunit C [Mariniblastus sp.]MDG1513947.1 cation:proton antiporter subunit C [Mariniblastus sp.]MDG2181208.1 cation:proton antiporter subunit C [Mariniblastus sp.]|eukprot:COSAG01_NODE_823_length_13300_cov_451.502310_5_plen_158_part_00